MSIRGFARKFNFFGIKNNLSTINNEYALYLVINEFVAYVHSSINQNIIFLSQLLPTIHIQPSSVSMASDIGGDGVSIRRVSI